MTIRQAIALAVLVFTVAYAFSFGVFAIGLAIFG